MPGFILTEYSAACCVGSMLLQNLYPKGQNSVIPRPLAAGIGILKVLPVYFLGSVRFLKEFGVKFSVAPQCIMKVH
jgi:hypothetical protein